MTAADTGVREAIATGEARKRDLKVLVGGLLSMGMGAPQH